MYFNQRHCRAGHSVFPFLSTSLQGAYVNERCRGRCSVGHFDPNIFEEVCEGPWARTCHPQASSGASFGEVPEGAEIYATMETIYTILDHGLSERFWSNFGSIGVVFSALICSLGFHTNASKHRRPRYRSCRSSKLLTLYETQCATLSHLCSGSCKCGL